MLIMIFLLIGCSGTDKLIMQRSGIDQDIKYTRYQQFLKEGKLDADGYYSIDKTMEELTEEQEILPDAIK